MQNLGSHERVENTQKAAMSCCQPHIEMERGALQRQNRF